jgi:Cof subfamily protein (haloacid dehalogenase superfamily)
LTAARDIRLLVADVDGTLVTGEKVLTKAAQDVVFDLHRAGIAFAITSSRPPRGMRMLIEPLSLDGVIAGCNGGLYVNPDLSVIQCYPLDPVAAKKTVSAATGEGVDVWVYTEREWLVRDRQAPHVAREEWILKFAPRIVPSFDDSVLAGAAKIVAVSDDPDRIAGCQRSVQLAVGDMATVLRSQSYFLDVTNPLANKGVVVETLSKRLHIPPEQIATIGDMPTDVLMFRKSGFSIAMGNASDEVKAQASATTDSNENDGFAKAVRKFILEQAGA